MSRWRHAVCGIVAVSLAACGGAETPPSPGPEPASLDGVWETVGYGFVTVIGPDQVRGYEVTATSCLATLEGELRAASGPPPFGVELPVEAEVTLVMDGFETTLAILPGAGPDEKRFHNEWAASSMVARRIDALPERCRAPAGDSPAELFEIVWQTYREHYPFFAMKGIDWQRVGEEARSRIVGETGEADLFEILKESIEPLEDAHTFLQADSLEQRFGGFRPIPHVLDAALRRRALEIVEEEYLETGLARWCNDRVAFGRLGAGIGYLRLTSFSGYGADFAAGMQALDAALDEIFGGEPLPALVIDVRINGGGSDLYGQAIAARLTDREYLAYTKEAILDPGEPQRWTDGQPSRIRPGERPGFLGPAVLLTGPYSVSAAETFTMALMGRRPEVRRIGEPTQGVFSDVLGRTLPNGWHFGLPNERFLTAGGESFDGPGIPPDVEVPVFRRADLEAGRDAAVEKALELLGRDD